MPKRNSGRRVRPIGYLRLALAALLLACLAGPAALAAPKPKGKPAKPADSGGDSGFAKDGKGVDFAGAVCFDRDSGQVQGDRLQAALPLDPGTKVNDLFFSPDGRSLVLDCERFGERFLWRVKLKLTAAEEAVLKNPPAPPGPAVPQVPARPANPRGVQKA